MLAFDPDQDHEDQRFDSTKRAASGAMTGFLCRALVQPLDVIKIRFQLQVEPITHDCDRAKYRSVAHIFRLMVREEGYRSLWKGLFASQLISVVYTPIQFSAFYALTEYSVKRLHYRHDSPLMHLTCGGLAGMMAITAAHPFDTLRTRLVGQGEPKLYRSPYHAFRVILATEGLSGLYRGLIPNVLLVGPQAAATFFGYEICKQLLNDLFPPINDGDEDSVIKNLTAGAIAGTFAKSLIYPLDSIKKRLQVQGFEEARTKFGSVRKYGGTIDCMIKIAREETLFGLFKGFIPSLYKAAAVTALNFAIFEHFIRLW